MNEKELQNNFIENRDEHLEKLTLDAAIQILRLESEMKELKDDIKEVKSAAKDEGVLIKYVNSALTKLKKMQKITQDELDEEDEIFALLRENSEINSLIISMSN